MMTNNYSGKRFILLSIFCFVCAFFAMAAVFFAPSRSVAQAETIESESAVNVLETARIVSVDKKYVLFLTAFDLAAAEENGVDGFVYEVNGEEYATNVYYGSVSLRTDKYDTAKRKTFTVADIYGEDYADYKLVWLELENDITSDNDYIVNIYLKSGETIVASGEELLYSVKGKYTQGLHYVLNSDGESYSVAGIGDATDNDIVIPSKYNGKPVTSIGDYAFYGCSDLTSVYYGGTEEEWSNIDIGGSNDSLMSATRYYYSESEPTVKGHFWHYEGGEVVVWAGAYKRVNSEGVESATGEYILFGEYPQTVKADDVDIIDTTDSRGYYLGSDGAYYAKVTANPYYSGYTFTTGATITKGETYYFKVEPIKWRILEEAGGKATMLCEMIIDAHRFDGVLSGSNNYKESEIRAWLIGEFYETAFNDLEQTIINTVVVRNDARSTNPDNNATYWDNGKNEDACEDTNDKVFILSNQEVTKADYGFATSPSTYDTARRKKTTDYAIAIGLSGGTDYWWLRSPRTGVTSFYVWRVTYEGQLRAGTFDYTTSYIGVVPALQITL